MADHVLLEAGDDLVRQLSHEREAVKAVLELVWNSLDADATQVDVVIERAGTTGIDKIVVTDDGDGITPEKARTAFKQVGNSDKRVGGTTDRLQRPLHERPAADVCGPSPWATRRAGRARPAQSTAP